MNTDIIATRIKRLIFSLMLTLGLLTPVAISGSAAAANVFSGAKEEACAGVRLESSSNDCKGGAQSVTNIIGRVIDFISVVVGVICVIVIIISGLRYVTSNGDSNNITSARNTFIYALVGLILVAFAQLIVKLVIARIN